MGGILLIVLLAGYCALTIFLFIKVKPWWGKATVLVAAILIPTADDIYYRGQLESYCKNEAGFHGDAVVKKSDGLYFLRGGGEFYFNRYNLNLVEWRTGSYGKLYRLSRAPDTEIMKEQIAEIKSKYELDIVINRSPPFRYTSYQIRDIHSKEIISEVKDAAYYGGWFYRGLLGSIADSGPTLVADCGYEGKSPPEFELINKTILTNVNVLLKENR